MSGTDLSSCDGAVTRTWIGWLLNLKEALNKSILDFSAHGRSKRGFVLHPFSSSCGAETATRSSVVETLD
jgi:hypothetical protein